MWMVATLSGWVFRCKMEMLMFFMLVFVMVMRMVSFALIVIMWGYLIRSWVMAGRPMLMFMMTMAMLIVMIVFFFMALFMMWMLMVRMRTAMMSSCVFVSMQDIQNVQVANQSEDRSDQHISWFLHYLLMDDSTRCFNEKLHSYDPNDSYIQKSSQRLHFFISECEPFGTLLIAHEDSEERDHICQNIRK